jgi:dihydroxyacetone kinase-like protein
MTNGPILACIDAIHQSILSHEKDIEALDREIGDGDHYINIRRGITLIQGMRDELGALPANQIFHKIGNKLLTTIGGASGPLIASFFLAMGKALDGRENIDKTAFAAAFETGVEAIKSRGKADLGEKTMLDVLIPVARLLKRMAEAGESPEAILLAAKEEAYRGMMSTRDMVAVRGRAQFLGERALGHIDPGSKTCQVAIWAVCDQLLA